MKQLIFALIVSTNAHAVDTYEAREVAPDEVLPVRTAVEATPVAPVDGRVRGRSIRYQRNAELVPPPVVSTIAPSDAPQVENADEVTAVPPTEVQALGPEREAAPIGFQQMAEETRRRDQRNADNQEAENRRKAAANRWTENQKLQSPQRQADNAEAEQRRQQAATDWQKSREGAAALAELPKATGPVSFMQPIPQNNEQAGNAPGRAPVAGAYVNPVDAKPGEKDASTKIAEDDFRCVYGGVFVTGDKCRPARRMSQSYFGEKLENPKVTVGKKTVDLAKVVCAPSYRNAKGKIVRSTDQKTGLCEPLRYGLQANGKAICAQPGPSHIEGCKSSAKLAGEASKQWALAIMKANPKAAQKYASVQSRVCGEKAHKWNGKITSPQQLRDIEATCGSLNARTADLGITEDVKKLALKPASAPVQQMAEAGR